MATDARRLPRTTKKPVSVTTVVGLVLVGLLVVWLIVNLVKTPSDFVEIFLIGLTTGCIYALVALGYTLVYGILELINFAHGDVFMLGGMVSATVLATWFGVASGDTGVMVWLAVFGTLIVSMAFCGVLNASIEFVAYKPLRGAPRLAPLITAIGMSFILQNVALAWKGPNYIEVVDVLPHSNVFSMGGVDYQWNKLIVVLITVPVLLLLVWLVERTRQGKAMRATAQDRDAAAMMGINVNRTISFTFLIAGAPRRRGRSALRPVRDQHPLRPGLPARPDRVHRRRARRDRQPARRGARSDSDRAHSGVQRGPVLACSRQRLDAVDRVRDPDPDPRLQARGPARRTDAGRRVTNPWP